MRFSLKNAIRSPVPGSPIVWERKWATFAFLGLMKMLYEKLDSVIRTEQRSHQHTLEVPSSLSSQLSGQQNIKASRYIPLPIEWYKLYKQDVEATLSWTATVISMGPQTSRQLDKYTGIHKVCGSHLDYFFHSWNCLIHFKWQQSHFQLKCPSIWCLLNVPHQTNKQTPNQEGMLFC